MKAILRTNHSDVINNRSVQMYLGHRDISVTQKYRNSDDMEKYRRAERLFQNFMEQMAKKALGEDTLECCFCGKPVIAYKSHNPAPAESDPTRRCCEDCNSSIVQPFRHKVFTTPEEQLDENCKQWLNNRISISF